MSDWTGEQILATARGFMEPRILLTAAELDLFTLLRDHRMTATQVTDAVSGDQRALTALLDALSALGMLVKTGEQYETEPSAAPLLSSDTPQSVLPMVLHAAHLWRTWSGLTDRARGPNAQPPTDAEHEQARLRAFIEAMHVVASPQADAVVAAANPGTARRLIDIGGGPATYTIAFLRAVPGLHVTLFDRPPVVEIARTHLNEADLLNRVTLAPGDFYTDDLPGGHDLAWVSAIIHQNSLAQNVDLYRKVYDALVPGGRVVIRDHIMSPDRTQPKAGALFAINMLAGTPGGGTYTFAEIRSGLEEAGFTRVGQLQTDERMNGLIEAFKE